MTGCKDNIANQNEVFTDAQQRVHDNVLPDVNAEAEVVLRNLVNVLAIFPQVCATPLAKLDHLATLRDFKTFFPTLKKPAPTYNDADGEWTWQWSNVLLGADDPQRAGPEVAPVNLTLRALFRGQNDAALRAVPFSLAPQTALQTVGVPAAFTTGITEGFFLYQDGHTGAWFLRWRGGNNIVFTGTINAFTGISRLIRRPPDPNPDTTNNSIDSLHISENTQEVTFHAKTSAGNENGFTFYARPGDAIQFRLRLGSSDGTVHDITANDLHIGANGVPLPGNKAAPDFLLFSSEPLDPTDEPLDPDTGEPLITSEKARGTFLWQDVSSSSCARNEDQWRLRFTSSLSSDTFSGKFTGETDNTTVTIRATPVAPCPDTPLQDGGRTLNYTCTLGNGQVGGYDVCAPAGTRITAEPRNNTVREPRMVFIGAEGGRPPSPDPFTIRFDIELEELNSARHVQFSKAQPILHGNNPDIDQKLDPAHVSLEPPCVDGQRLLARLTGQGDYGTDRFTGSLFIMDQVEFHDEGLFPNGGITRLKTRVEEEATEIEAFMDTATSQKGGGCFLDGDVCSVATTVHITVNNVPFAFPNQPVVLTAD